MSQLQNYWAIFCVSALLHADMGFDPACGPQSSIDPLKKQEMFFTHPARAFSFTAELLAWDSNEEGLEYAYKNRNTQSNQSLSSFAPKSKFEPAFRLGLEGTLPYDHWTLGALYTFYRTTKHSSSSYDFNPTALPGPGMIAVWTYPSAFTDNNTGARFKEAKGRWKLHSSFCDLSLGRQWGAGSWFSLTPAFGLRSAWLHQRYQVDYSSGNRILFGADEHVSVISSRMNMNCASNNAGLLFGCDMKWLIGKQWNVFSDMSGSFLASRFHVSRHETDLFTNSLGALNTETITLKTEYWTFRPQAQIAIGIQFSDAFHGNTPLSRYFVSLAYEAQIWWKQNQLLRYIDQLNSSSAGAYVTPTQGDLLFHGIDLEAGFSY